MKLEETEFKPELFRNYTTIILGTSSSGKTTVAKHIIMALAKETTYLYAFVNGPEAEKEASNLTSRVFISDKITEEKLSKIWDRQEAFASLYKLSNDVDILKTLYDKVKTDKSEDYLGRIESAREKIRRKFGTKGLSKAKQDMIKKANDAFDNAKKIIYKKTIKSNKAELNKQKLTKQQYTVIRYINLPKPNMIIFFDDVSEQFKSLPSSAKNVLYEIFTQSRHKFVTIVMNLHDDTRQESDIRKAVRNIIFCSSDKIGAYFSRQYSKDVIKKKEQNSLREILDNNEQNKIFYNKNTSKFNKLNIDFEIPISRVGHPIVLHLGDLIEKKDYSIKKSNSMYRDFSVTDIMD